MNRELQRYYCFKDIALIRQLTTIIAKHSSTQSTLTESVKNKGQKLCHEMVVNYQTHCPKKVPLFYHCTGISEVENSYIIYDSVVVQTTLSIDETSSDLDNQ